MRRFKGFRPNAPEHYYTEGYAVKPDEVQYEGIVFSDGTVVIRWCTEFKSHSVWADYDTFYKIHGHPEYGTIIQWLDPNPSTDLWSGSRCRHCNEQLFNTIPHICKTDPESESEK